MIKIVRNDITKMHTEAIVNTANDHPTVGTGCDNAVYKAAGYDELLRYRKEQVGFVPEGEAFLTPGFALSAKWIIHAVSPKYIDGKSGEEKKLRSCYRKSLELAKKQGVRSISIPLISTGGFGYPKEEGMRIAMDEIHAFLLQHEMDIFLVVFDLEATSLGERIAPDLEEYIDQNYVDEKNREEYVFRGRARYNASVLYELEGGYQCFEELHEEKLQERMDHLEDSFSEYLLYLIGEKGLTNTEVYKGAIVDKKTFSKIKNHPDYHPTKLTALCLCVGAKLNLDEAKDLLARAGYALSPCDKMDIIFSYFIENEIYDMIELDIQLEEHGLPCIIN